jgi:MFS family permease
MPGVIEACGLPASLSGSWLAIIGLCNIVGSVASGAIIRHVSKRKVLAVLYALRALGVALFVAAPKTEAAVLAFSVWIGLTFMATLAPTSGLIADLFGVRRLATLLGVTMLVHQVGSFLGVWLGGLAFAASGSYDWVWKADAALAMLAAACALAVREGTRATTPDRPRSPVRWLRRAIAAGALDRSGRTRHDPHSSGVTGKVATPPPAAYRGSTTQGGPHAPVRVAPPTPGADSGDCAGLWHHSPDGGSADDGPGRGSARSGRPIGSGDRRAVSGRWRRDRGAGLSARLYRRVRTAW